MARVRVRVEDFEDGAFPPVCVVSGRRCESTTPIELPVATSPTKAAMIAVLVFGLLAFLFANRPKPVRGYLPVLQESLDAIRRRRRQGTLLSVGSLLALLPVAILSGDLADGVVKLLMLTCFAGIFVGLYWYLRPKGAPGAALDPTLRWLELFPVSDEFAAAYTALEDQRRTERQRHLANDE